MNTASKNEGDMSRVKDLTGERFGSMTVLRFEFTRGRRAWFRCRCDCGKEVVRETRHIRSGLLAQCGRHRESGPEIERFWRKAARGPDCWTWIGRTNAYGYGIFDIGGRHEVASRWLLRFILADLFVDELEVCHSCDNPSCVRPDHLFVATHKENMRDAQKKGRLFRRNRAKAGGAS